MGAGCSSRKDIMEKVRRDRHELPHSIGQALIEVRRAIVDMANVEISVCLIKFRKGES